MSGSKWGGARSRRARAVVAPMVAAGIRCWRCKKPILPGQAWDADHRQSRTHGGKDDVSNLLPAHRRCNQAAGGRIGAAITNARKQTVIVRRESERDRGIRGW